MTRARVFIGCTATVLGVAVLGSSALAGTTEPGFLQASDLPGTLEQVGGPVSDTTVNELAIDAETCTQTFAVDATASGFIGVRFAIPVSGVTVLTETVITYPDAKTAMAAVKRRAASARAGAKCGSVANVTPGQTSSSIAYDKVKFPKIGGDSHAIARSSDVSGATAAVAVEFVLGPYLVVVNTVGNIEGPTVKELKAIARKAEKRVREGA